MSDRTESSSSDRVAHSRRIPAELLRRCRFLAGPTASGKSDAGALLATRIGGEIVSMDSMSLYRGMDIGTAKPTAELRALVPHHLVDVVDPSGDFSLAEYLSAAERAANEIAARGRVPIFVGGTGLYLRGLLRGVFEGPAADPVLRLALESEAENTPDGLHTRLREADPATAALLHPRDTRRLIRALEVIALTGRPLSELQQQRSLPPAERPRHVYWLSPPRRWLYERINARVERMFSDGLVDEVRGLLAGGGLGRTASQALGYREVIEHFAGRFTLAETIATVQTRTRQFAKRQHTWFRNLEECRPVAMTGDESPAELAETIQAASDS